MSELVTHLLAVKPVILRTDALIFLLVGVVAAFAIYARRHEHLHAPWRRVLGTRTGAATLVVLVAYVVVALLDSLHFREPLPTRDSSARPTYAIEVLSVLDLLLSEQREHSEKTYSAPFATHLFVKETMEREDGTRVRGYPRLVYGGAHLDDPAIDRGGDITSRMAVGTMKGLGIWGACALAAFAWVLRRRACSGAEAVGILMRGDSVAWPAILVTVACVVLVGSIAMSLSAGYHIFGTDKVGQDVFYQTIKSIRTALVIGTLTTLVMLPFAVALGIMAGYFRGWIDDAIQYLYTTLNSIPGVLLIASAVLTLQVYIDTHAELFDTTAARADLRLLFLCLILGVTSWTGLCRLLRGETMKLHEVDYVQAAVAFGVRHARVMSRHLLPNVMHIVLITVVLDFSGLVLAEAVLSYVGVGVDPTMFSWGNMINSARLEMAREPMVWWSLLAAFVFMFVLVLAANLFADAVRDAFDPRLRTA